MSGKLTPAPSSLPTMGGREKPSRERLLLQLLELHCVCMQLSPCSHFLAAPLFFPPVGKLNAVGVLQAWQEVFAAQCRNQRQVVVCCRARSK